MENAPTRKESKQGLDIDAIKDNAGTRPILNEEMLMMTGGALDEFDLSPRYAQEIGFPTETHDPRWVRNPEYWRRMGEVVDRPDAFADAFPGSRLHLDPEGSQIKRGDLVLMQLPKAHAARIEAEMTERRDAYTAMHPAVALEAGMSDTEVLGYLEKYGDPQALAIREEEFDREDRQKMIRRAALARDVSRRARALRISPTFGMTYEEAYESQLRKVARDYGEPDRPLSREAARKKLAEEIERVEARARRGAAQDAGRENWAQDMERARAQMSRQFGFANTGFPRNPNSPLAQAGERERRERSPRRNGGR